VSASAFGGVASAFSAGTARSFRFRRRRRSQISSTPPPTNNSPPTPTRTAVTKTPSTSAPKLSSTFSGAPSADGDMTTARTGSSVSS
jgi:hypothetical protein